MNYDIKVKNFLFCASLKKVLNKQKNIKDSNKKLLKINDWSKSYTVYD